MNIWEKIREARKKNSADAEKEKQKTEGSGNTGTSVKLDRTPENARRINPLWGYIFGGIIVLCLAGLGLNSCMSDKPRPKKDTASPIVQGDVLNDRSIEQINNDHLKALNDAEGGKEKSADEKKKTPSNTKPEADQNTVVDRNASRQSASRSSAEAKPALSPEEQYELDAAAARYKRALKDEETSSSEEAQARKSAIFFDLKEETPAKTGSGSATSPANSYYNDVIPGGDDSDYIQIVGR